MRILALDIETRPAKVWSWDLFDQGPTPLSMVIEPGGMLCFAASWIEHPTERSGPRSMMFFSEWEHGHDGMVAAAHALLDEADVVVHYNGKRFDIPHLNREFLEAGLAPPSPYFQVDLWLTARRFKFLSSKLEHVSRRLGLAGKVQHEGFGLWDKVMAGDPAARRRMERYNRQDVRLLHEAYRILLPWIPAHPNRRLYDPEHAHQDACPKCGSVRLQRRGLAHTRQSVYQQWQCQACGSWFRTTKRISGTEVTDVAA